MKFIKFSALVAAVSGIGLSGFSLEDLSLAEVTDFLENSEIAGKVRQISNQLMTLMQEALEKVVDELEV